MVELAAVWMVGLKKGRMVKRTYTNPVTGDTLRFIRTSAETGGELLEVEVQYTPVHDRPPAHYHPSQEECFEVLEGSITVGINGEERVYRAGESFVVPSRTTHSMWNAGDTSTRMIWQIRPALNTQQFFETMWGMGQDGKLGSGGSPNVLQGAVLMRAYANEFRLAHPSQAIQRLLFAVLAPIGRWLGYKSYYNS